MPLPVLKSKDGQITRVVTSKEELEEYLDKGYKRVSTEKPAEKPANPAN